MPIDFVLPTNVNLLDVYFAISFFLCYKYVHYVISEKK